MDSKELRGLMEAYSEVYAPQEVDEGLRSAVKRLLGGGKKEAEAPKPESRGEQLRKKYNVGPEKSDTSAKRQILNRSRARAERDERDYGNSKYSKSVAQKSKEAHDRYLKAGYSKYGADDARGSGNKARKRAAALNREEFDWLVNSLLDEGYDLSTYTVEEFYDFCCEESEQLDEVLDTPEKANEYARKNVRSMLGAFAKGVVNKDISQLKTINKRTEGAKRAKRKAERKAAEEQKESFDIFDVVLEFLQAEGYAETLEEAEWMMANMIDEEAIGIILGEASSRDEFTRAAIARNSGRKGGITFEPGPNWDPSANRGKGAHLSPKQKEKQRRKALRQEDFELWVNELVEEGYDLSEYTWDEMYDIYEEQLDEALTGERYKKVMKKPGGTAYSRKVSADPAKRATRGGKGGESDFGAGDRGAGNKAARRAGTYKEYNVNEAQAARNNPEKYEREQSKKYAPVRGERTPMPPRGDKRREDFEKWYAKQMGR